MKRYAFIEAEKVGGRSVKRACELLQVSRAAFYAARVPSGAAGAAGAVRVSQRAAEDVELTELITQVHDETDGRYGAPRVHAELQRRGRHHGRKRIARLMRSAGIAGRTPKRWRRTTVADPAAAARLDLVGRDFQIDAAAVNTRWCGDITYIRTWQGWLYLATVIDIASRRVVGYAIADHLRTDLVTDALSNALAARDPDSDVVFHSDRGCQYTSAQFAALATENSVRLSVGRTGQCWDNALAESFFAALKRELIDTRAWPTHNAVRYAIVSYISWYNNFRLHSTLGYRSPAEYENLAA